MSIKDEYAGAEELPLGSYAALVALFGLGLAAVLRRGTKRMPERVPIQDAVAMGVATHELTRVITKDWVTAPLRAPFVRYERGSSGGEVEESPRGHGMQRALGDLLTCRYCTGPWVALGLIAAYLEAPRVARTIAWLFSTAAISDWLHRGYASLEPRASAPASERSSRTTEPEIRLVRVPHYEAAPSDGQSMPVMTEHVDLSPDDIPEATD